MNNQPENNISENETGNLTSEADVSEAGSEIVDTALENSEQVEEMSETEATQESADGENSKPDVSGVLKSLFDYVEIFAFSVLAVLLIFTFCFRLCRVDGQSMNHTLEHGEMLITTNLFYEPKPGDVIVFHLSNNHFTQPLVKRVIATEGQTVEINFTTGVVSVDGVTLTEDYIFVDGGAYDIRSEFDRQYLVTDEDGSIKFIATVPEGKVFAMGDNRNHSTDSRAVSVGFVDENCILGKALVRISPFSLFN